MALDLWLLEYFFDDGAAIGAGVTAGLTEPVATGLESKLTDLPPTGDAEA